MRVAVGSKNPVKIRAVELAVQSFWPEATIVSETVPSGVSEQPRSEAEAIDGAMNRARLSMEMTGAEMGFGMEGYTFETGHGMFLSGIVVVLDSSGKKGIGCSGRMLLPEKLAAEIRNGEELGPLVDRFIGGNNIKQKQGTIGIFTKGKLSRTEEFEKAVTLALAPFISPEFYE